LIYFRFWKGNFSNFTPSTHMNFRKALRRFSTTGFMAIAVAFGTLGNQPLNAQFSDCVNAGSNSLSWANEARDISIGREIYRSVARISPRSRSGEAVVTCRIDPTSGTTYKYAVGFEDKDSNTYPAELSIYLNGNPVSRQTIRHGQLYSKLIDTAGARSVSIEAVCTRTSGCRGLMFVQLGAESPRSSPGQR
jgi:hypothetical protein